MRYGEKPYTTPRDQGSSEIGFTIHVHTISLAAVFILIVFMAQSDGCCTLAVTIILRSCSPRISLTRLPCCVAVSSRTSMSAAQPLLPGQRKQLQCIVRPFMHTATLRWASHTPPQSNHRMFSFFAPRGLGADGSIMAAGLPAHDDTASLRQTFLPPTGTQL